MSVTLGDIYNGATSGDPGQAFTNYLGNLTVGGGGNPAPAISTAVQPNAYQFQGNPAAAPVAPGGLGLQMPQTMQAPMASAAPVAPVMPQTATTPAPQAMPQAMPQPVAPAVPQQTQQVQAAGLTPQALAPVNPQAEMGAPLPQPGVATQVAGPMPTPQTQPQPQAQPAPAAPAAPGEMTGPGLQPTAQSQTAFTDPLNHFVQNQKDMGVTANYALNSQADPGLRKAAAEQSMWQLNHVTKMDQAQQKVEQDIKNGNTSDFAKALASNDDKGSYLKAYLFHRFGLNDLAKNEQQKLGADNKWGASIDDKGNRALINYDGNNMPVSGYDRTGRKLTGDELASFAASATPLKGAEIGSQAMRDAKTGQVYYQQKLPNGTWAYRDQNGAVAPDVTRLHPFGVGSDIEMKNQIQVNELQNKLAYAPIQKRAEILAESEAKYGPLPQNYKDQVMNLPSGVPAQGQIQNTAPTSQVQAAPTAPTAAPTAAPTPVAPARPVASAAPARPVATAPVNPSAPAPIPSNPYTTPPVAVGGMGGATPAQRETQQKLTQEAGTAEIQKNKELQVAEAKPAAEAKGKLNALDIKNQGYADRVYDLIQPINEEIKKSTGSGIGAKVDQLAALFGKSTTGAQAAAKLDVLGYQLVANVPRFEGAQSDRDVKLYQQAAGDVADKTQPIATRLSALQGVVTILKKYDKAGNHDWSFGQQQSDVRSRADAIIGGGR